MERVFTISEIAEMIEITELTLRQYTQALELAGYRFNMDHHGNCTYIARDAMAIRMLKEVRTKTKLPTQQTAALVVTVFKGTLPPISEGDRAQEIDTVQRYDSQYEAVAEEVSELREGMRKLAELNREMSMQLEANHQVIRQLSEIVTAQKAIAAAHEDWQEELERLRHEQLIYGLREQSEAKQETDDLTALIRAISKNL